MPQFLFNNWQNSFESKAWIASSCHMSQLVFPQDLGPYFLDDVWINDKGVQWILQFSSDFELENGWIIYQQLEVLVN